MPLLHRTDSDTTHASDSDPEREARRRAHNKSPAKSAPSSPPPHRTPLSPISNTVLEGHRARRTLHNRLSAIEADLAEIKEKLDTLRPQMCARYSGRLEQRNGYLTLQPNFPRTPTALIRPYRKSTWAAKTRSDYPMREWSPVQHLSRWSMLLGEHCFVPSSEHRAKCSTL
ncbi:hypothetical protein DFH09DRAFT_1099301 [Mycena vulgaris]|nr:hypothetical protein DFH09DRAFT_1099301 [Mycena vulgaris]